MDRSRAAVWAVLVVVLLERVELSLQLRDRLGCGLGCEEAFEGLVEPFDLALGLGVPRGAVLLPDAEEGQEVFEGVAAAAEAGGVDAAIVGECRCGGAVFVDDGQEGGDDVAAGDGAWAVQDSKNLEWSSSQFKISTSVPSARRQWVKSDCQVSFGWAASKRTKEDLGRLRGSGVIRPAVCRMRRIVEVDGGR